MIADSPDTARETYVQRRNRFVARFDQTCQYCGVRSASPLYGPDRRSWVVEHMQARKRGGADNDANLTLSCWTCNIHKGVDVPDGPWRQRIGIPIVQQSPVKQAGNAFRRIRESAPHDPRLCDIAWCFAISVAAILDIVPPRMVVYGSNRFRVTESSAIAIVVWLLNLGEAEIAVKATLKPQPFPARHTPRASLSPDLTCCFYSPTAFCPGATALRCFRCGVPACYRHLDAHVARCELVAA